MMPWRLAALLCFFLASLPAASHSGAAPAATGVRAVPFSLSPQQRDELLRFAKGTFLAGLGLSKAAPAPVEFPKLQKACFVTFFSGKRVIACFGGFQPRSADLLHEVAANIDGALRNDPRARHISSAVAKEAGVQITFPQELVPIRDYRQVDPQREGLFLESDDNGVAIVPGEAKTAAWAYREGLRRLGVRELGTVRMYKFQATCISTRR